MWWPFTKIKHKTTIFRQVNRRKPKTHQRRAGILRRQLVLLTFLQRANKPRFFSFQHPQALRLARDGTCDACLALAML